VAVSRRAPQVQRCAPAPFSQLDFQESQRVDAGHAAGVDIHFGGMDGEFDR